MNNRKAILIILTAICTMAFGGEAFARGGKGQGARLRDGSCGKNQTSTQTETRQRLRDGSGAGKGKMAGQRNMNQQGGNANSTTPASGSTGNTNQ